MSGAWWEPIGESFAFGSVAWRDRVSLEDMSQYLAAGRSASFAVSMLEDGTVRAVGILGGTVRHYRRTDDEERRAAYLVPFTLAYCEALLWANTSDDTGEEVYPEQWQTPAAGWQLEAFTSEARESIASDCDDFVAAQWRDLQSLDPAQCGHDFLLTRSGHGAGFWDRGYGELGERLSVAARVYGDSQAYVRSDNLCALF